MEDIRLGLNEPRRQLVEGVHEHRLGSATRAHGRDVPELLLQGRGHQDRTFASYREIVQRVVPRKDGYRGEFHPAAGSVELRSWWRGHRVAHMCSLAWGTCFAHQESRSVSPEVSPYGGVRSGCDRGGAAGTGDRADRRGGVGGAGRGRGRAYGPDRGPARDRQDFAGDGGRTSGGGGGDALPVRARQPDGAGVPVRGGAPVVRTGARGRARGTWRDVRRARWPGAAAAGGRGRPGGRRWRSVRGVPRPVLADGESVRYGCAGAAG